MTALLRNTVAESLLPEEEKDESLTWGPCEKQSFKDPILHRGLRYWTVAAAIHSFVFIALMLILMSISSSRNYHSHQTLRHTGDELFSNLPVSQDILYKSQYLSSDAWTNNMYMGTPNLGVDKAWEDLVYPRGFQLYRDEAARLNLTKSLLMKPNGEIYGTILGVIHNLHCLRRIRQSYYPDVYYPNATEEVLANNRGHDLHCLEAIRSSLVCYPDLNPHPYYWSGREWHDVTVSAKVTRQCVDWEALQTLLVPRDFKGTELIRDEHSVT